MKNLITISALVAASFLSACEEPSNTSTENKAETIIAKPDTVAVDPVKEKAMAKVKKKLEIAFPNDYLTQEMMLNENSDAYDYMAEISDKDPIKKKLQSNFSYDYVTQKLMYDEEVAAKERLNK